MSDDVDELGRRLDRIEQTLRRPPEGSGRLPAGPEIRSARSIVNRVDDVWVAVTEGNERLAAAIASIRADLTQLTAALVEDGNGSAEAEAEAEAEGGTDDGSGKPKLRLPESSLPRTDLDGRLARIEQGLARAGEARAAFEGQLGSIEGALATLTRTEDPDPAVHLRLNRMEEALAGIAERLGELADRSTATTAASSERLGELADRSNATTAASSERLGELADRSTATTAGIAEPLADPGVTALVQGLGAEVRRLASRVDGLARVLEASAARTADGTLVDRLGRLRDQFRR